MGFFNWFSKPKYKREVIKRVPCKMKTDIYSWQVQQRLIKEYNEKAMNKEGMYTYIPYDYLNKVIIPYVYDEMLRLRKLGVHYVLNGYDCNSFASKFKACVIEAFQIHNPMHKANIPVFSIHYDQDHSTMDHAVCTIVGNDYLIVIEPQPNWKEKGFLQLNLSETEKKSVYEIY